MWEAVDVMTIQKYRHPIKEREYSQKYRLHHINQVKEAHRTWVIKLKTEVLSHYSKGILRCACCGEQDFKKLALDHFNGDGTAHRKNNRLFTGTQTYLWVKRNGFPSIFQVLCRKCNNQLGSNPHPILEDN